MARRCCRYDDGLNQFIQGHGDEDTSGAGIRAHVPYDFGRLSPLGSGDRDRKVSRPPDQRTQFTFRFAAPLFVHPERKAVRQALARGEIFRAVMDKADIYGLQMRIETAAQTPVRAPDRHCGMCTIHLPHAFWLRLSCMPATDIRVES